MADTHKRWWPFGYRVLSIDFDYRMWGLGIGFGRDEFEWRLCVVLGPLGLALSRRAGDAR